MDILELQTKLDALGFSPGALDDQMGPQTIAAIKRFQEARGLVVDGIAGPKTLAALDAPVPVPVKPKPAVPSMPAPKVSQKAVKTSAKGRALIEQREGVKLKAYQDSVGVWTIGVGHTSVAGPPHVIPGLTITQAQCDEILSRDLAKFETAVSDAVHVTLADHEFDALVSLAFNIGGNALAKSTVVRRLNNRDREGAADAFLAFNEAGGKEVPGLTSRRKSERLQFLNAYA
jgi:GH24 family phage-related lysozyme (muramidase)